MVATIGVIVSIVGVAGLDGGVVSGGASANAAPEETASVPSRASVQSTARASRRTAGGFCFMDGHAPWYRVIRGPIPDVPGHRWTPARTVRQRLHRYRRI